MRQQTHPLQALSLSNIPASSVPRRTGGQDETSETGPQSYESIILCAPACVEPALPSTTVAAQTAAREMRRRDFLERIATPLTPNIKTSKKAFLDDKAGICGACATLNEYVPPTSSPVNARQTGPSVVYQTTRNAPFARSESSRFITSSEYAPGAVGRIASMCPIRMFPPAGSRMKYHGQ